jgi:hypothetical protein
MREANDGDQRGRKSRRQEEIEAHPGDIPVVHDVLARQGRSQVRGPREEREHDAAQDQQQPVAALSQVVNDAHPAIVPR